MQLKNAEDALEYSKGKKEAYFWFVSPIGSVKKRLIRDGVVISLGDWGDMGTVESYFRANVGFGCYWDTNYWIAWGVACKRREN